MSLWIWNNTFFGAWLIKEKYKQKKISLVKPLRAGQEIFSCPAKSLRFFFPPTLCISEWSKSYEDSHENKSWINQQYTPVTLLAPSTHWAPTGSTAQLCRDWKVSQLTPCTHTPPAASAMSLELLLFSNITHWPEKCTSMQSHAKKADEGFSPLESTGPAPLSHFRKFNLIHPFLNKSSQSWHVPIQPLCQRSASQDQP